MTHGETSAGRPGQTGADIVLTGKEGDTMPKARRSGQQRTSELPGTLRRSSKEAQEAFAKAHDSAVQTYGEGDQANRAAYSELKRKFEKRGDHWIAKEPAEPGD